MTFSILTTLLSAFLSGPNANAIITPQRICNYDSNLKYAMESRLNKNCNLITARDLNRVADLIDPPGNDKAEVCKRSAPIREAILKVTGRASCAAVTRLDLLRIDQLYVEGKSGIPKMGFTVWTYQTTQPGLTRDLTTLTYTDLKGLALTNDLIVEFGYVAKIQPGAFRDMRSVKHIEISHGLISSLDPHLFCKDGPNGWNLPNLASLDLDSNLPFRGGTLPAGIFDCLGSLHDVDLDTNYLTSLSADLFRFNKKLVAIDLMNNLQIPASELAALDALNNGAVELETGIDREDTLEGWQCQYMKTRSMNLPRECR